MIEIDGSINEGGGQILRTALGLSAYTKKPFKIINIRKNRPQPGLKEQHLQAVNATAILCNAEVTGNSLHSTNLTFIPKEITKKELNIKVSTAGSIGLVLQALMIPALKSNLNIRRYGFYPKGGSQIEFFSNKSKLKRLNIASKEKIISINGISAASSSLKTARVSERQANSAKQILFKKFDMIPKINAIYSDSLCPGSGIQLWIKTEDSFIGANAIGELGKKSEIVGEEAANNLIFEFENGSIDQHTADQLIPYLALAGNSSILASKITEHAKTNIKVVKKFMDVDFKIDGNLIA